MTIAESSGDRRHRARRCVATILALLGGGLEYALDERVQIDTAVVQAAKARRHFGADPFDHFDADLLLAAGKMEIERAARRGRFLQQLGDADALKAARGE